MNKPILDKSVWLIPPKNRVRTKSLFKELYEEKGRVHKIIPPFTINEFDVYDEELDHTYLSFPKIVIEVGDPTGYRAAMKIFGSVKPWEKLFQDARLFAMLNEALRHVEIKIRSNAIDKMINSDNPASLKYLADRGWIDKPTRAKRVKEETIKAINSPVNADIKRLGIQV